MLARAHYQYGHAYHTLSMPCVADTFNNAAELRASPWFGYLDNVYSASTITRFPMSIGHL